MAEFIYKTYMMNRVLSNFQSVSNICKNDLHRMYLRFDGLISQKSFMKGHVEFTSTITYNQLMGFNPAKELEKIIPD